MPGFPHRHKRRLGGFYQIKGADLYLLCAARLTSYFNNCCKKSVLWRDSKVERSNTRVNSPKMTYEGEQGRSVTVSKRGTKGNISQITLKLPWQETSALFFRTCIFIIFHARSWWLLVSICSQLPPSGPHCQSGISSIPLSFPLSLFPFVQFFLCQLYWQWIPLSCVHAVHCSSPLLYQSVLQNIWTCLSVLLFHPTRPFHWDH